MVKSKNKYKHLAGLDKKTRLKLVTGVLTERPADCAQSAGPVKRKKKSTMRERPKKAVLPSEMLVKKNEKRKERKRPSMHATSLASENSSQPQKGIEVSQMSVEKRRRKDHESVLLKKDKQSSDDTLESRLMNKLQGGYFRTISEALYTKSGEEAEKMFSDDPTIFSAYHEGYRSQMSKWPVIPVVMFSKWLRKKSKNWKVADMGCGDGQLAKLVKNKVYSFDFVAVSDHITACNMSHVPLSDCQVHVCLFCLSLMGTNVADYINEAYRILKPGGFLVIIEILSRFKSVSWFCKALSKMGFQLKSKTIHHSYFVWLTFDKLEVQERKKHKDLKLKPCLYKKR